MDCNCFLYLEELLDPAQVQLQLLQGTVDPLLARTVSLRLLLLLLLVLLLVDFLHLLLVLVGNYHTGLLLPLLLLLLQGLKYLPMLSLVLVLVLVLPPASEAVISHDSGRGPPQQLRHPPERQPDAPRM